MRKKHYESAVIINAALEDTHIEAVVEKIKSTILQNGGEIHHINTWGRKRLAYVIKKQKIGYYVFFRFEAPTEAISQIERMYKLDEHIVRFLTITLDKKAVDFLKEQETKAAESIADVIIDPVIDVVPILDDSENIDV